MKCIIFIGIIYLLFLYVEVKIMDFVLSHFSMRTKEIISVSCRLKKMRFTKTITLADNPLSSTLHCLRNDTMATYSDNLH